MAPRPRKMRGLPEVPDTQERRRALQLILRERRRLLQSALAPRDGSPDPLDAAQALEEERIWLAVLDYSQETQAQVDAVLHLLEEGRYGQCVDCEKPIPPGRLQALPFALRCLPCQESFEAAGARKRRSALPDAPEEQDDLE